MNCFSATPHTECGAEVMRPIDMSDDDLRQEMLRCNHWAVMLGETSSLDVWTAEARRLRRILAERKKAAPGHGDALNAIADEAMEVGGDSE